MDTDACGYPREEGRLPTVVAEENPATFTYRAHHKCEVVRARLSLDNDRIKKNVWVVRTM